MALGQIGPLTAMLEAAAAAIGAGIVVGSAIVGLAWLMLGRSTSEIEGAAAIGGVVGGGFGAAVALLDLALRYAG